METKTSNIPPARLIDPEIENLLKDTKTYKLRELVNLKKAITDNINDTTNKLCSIKKPTLEETNKLIIKIKAHKFNLSIVKEMLSIANGPILTEIYTKSDLEGLRITLERLIAKSTTKREANYRKELGIKLENIKSKIATISKILETYNNEKSVTLELICV